MSDYSLTYTPESAETILDSIADGVFTVDMNWRITSFNRAAEQITGVHKEEALGRICSEVFRASVCESGCVVRQAVESGQPVINHAIFIIDAAGNQLPISVSASALKDEQGQVIGGVETFRDLESAEELRENLSGRFSFGNIVSRSQKMKRLFDILPQIAHSDSTVLIEGESGTGKELFARALHELSNRADAPFVAINCAALPDTLLESELFGYKAGAFTGAVRDKQGRFAAADGGTLFLDEIGDVSQALQVKLLRVLQEKTYEPLGAIKSIKSDVRILAASNKVLETLVESGKFREDLFYRINVIKLKLPPLRERREDIPLLVEHFIARLNHRNENEIVGIDRHALNILMSHAYPGNVRELENIIEHASVMCRGGLILSEHLPTEIVPEKRTSLKDGGGASLEEMERAMIESALERNHGNRQAAADELGIHKTTLFRKLKALGIEPPEKDGRSSKRKQEG